MYGAILGDLAGSRVEHTHNTDPAFEFWTGKDFFTDDTVLTLAVADALLQGAPFEAQLQEYCLRYPGRGYGRNFLAWAHTGEARLSSCGNGAPMRVSAVAYVAHTEEQVKILAEAATIPSHPHPDAVRAATTVALSIFRARMGATKEQVFDALTQDWPDLESVEAMRTGPRWEILAVPTVAQALSCVREADSFEDAVRNAVSIGGDADTIGAIAGSIAGPLFRIPPEAIRFARSMVDKRMLEVLDAFEERWPLTPPREHHTPRNRGIGR